MAAHLNVFTSTDRAKVWKFEIAVSVPDKAGKGIMFIWLPCTGV